MLFLLSLPIELLRIVFYALRGLVDVCRGHRRLRVEFTTLINAPRALVWRLITSDRVVLDGPPVVEILTEPLPDSDGLFITRVSVSGQPRAQLVARHLECNEAEGKTLSRIVPHALSVPPEGGRDCLTGETVAETPRGTALTVFGEIAVRSFRDRINYPIDVRRVPCLIKQQCEKEAGTRSRLTAFANHPLVLWSVALLLLSLLLGWQRALLLAVVLILHEAGHAAAMRMVGIEVRGIYLLPFFGASFVPKTAYRTQGRLGFIALMGPAVSLIPTLGLAAMYPVTGDIFFLQVAWLIALINLGNLSPLYPLDGGLIFNSLLGSVSAHLTAMATWIGVVTGLGLALYLQSNVVGILFLLFALQRYLGGNRTSELKPLSLVGGTGLALASIATFALYVFVLDFTRTAPAAWAASQLAEAKAEFRRAPTDAELRLAPTADFACPPVGTVFTMSMPLAISAEPVFRNHVSIIGNDRLGCHISSQANGVYWNHAGLVDRGNGRELQVAAENLWPLRVGNTTRANLQSGGHPWSIGFKVASYEKFTARVGTYDAFKIIEIDEYDGKFALEATRWWAPALSYTLSYRREPVTNPNDDQYFEIATINSHAP